MQTKTYIEFKFPGILFSETSTQEVESRSVKNVNVPDGAFAFSFFDLKIITDKDGNMLKSDKLSLSPMHYYGGQVFTFEQIPRLKGQLKVSDPDELIQTIKGYGGVKAICCRNYNWQPFCKDDIFISDKITTSL